MGNGDIFMAVCTLGNVRAEWAVGLASMHQHTGRTRHLSLIKHMGIADARNFAMATACAMDCEYLLFWDDDIIPHLTDAANRLITTMDQNPEIDVLGAVYPMRRFLPEPVCVEEKGQGMYWGWRDGKVHPVFMVGTGYMAIRIPRIKETVPEPYKIANTDVTIGRYFQIEDDGQGGVTTDDFWFAEYCKHWGVRQYVHGGVLCNQIQDDGEIISVQEAEMAVA